MKRNEKCAASDYMTAADLSAEIEFLNRPENKNKKDFDRRLSNLYAYSFLNRMSDLTAFLEKRFGNIQNIPDSVINIKII